MVQSKRGKLTNLKKSVATSETFDSLLERDYMLELEHNPAVKSWTKQHKIKIPYSIFGIRRNYLPDFLITFQNGQQELHETKGAGFLTWLSTYRKRIAGDHWAKTHGMKYRFIENSNGALFGTNMAIESAVKGKEYSSIDELMAKEGPDEKGNTTQ
jgi:hypothetical protein